MKNLQKINHESSVLNRSPAQIQNIMPGTIVDFRYPTKSGTKGDKAPMVLVIFIDLRKSLLHCVNLNYIPMPLIQKTFRKIASTFGIDVIEEEKGDKTETHSQVGMQSKDGGLNSTDGMKLYERIIVPDILPMYDCYRTYSLSKISSVKLVELDMKIIEDGMTRKSIDDLNNKEDSLLEYLKDADVLKEGGVQGLKFDKQGKRKENQ